jgi:glycosyltransferase involved in cell wall biosynthesis
MNFNTRTPVAKQGGAALSIVVPVFNEQYLVTASLLRLRVLGHSPLLCRIQVIVIDNGSTDQTPQILRRFQASLDEGWGCGKFEWEFVRIETNRGKGAAVIKGIELANGDFTVTHDADLEYYPADLLKMIPLFMEEDADAVFGSRFKGGGEFRRLLFLRHTLSNRLLTFLCGVVCNLDLSDIATCYKMVRTDLLKSIPLRHRDFRIDPEVVIKLAKRGARIYEIPISYSGRSQQEGKKIRIKDAIMVLVSTAKMAFSEELYKEDHYGSHILMRLRRAPRFYRWMADTLRPYLGQRVLEVGAGIGNLAVHLIPRESYWATDTNPLYLNTLRHLCATQPYLHTRLTDVAAADSFPEGQQFDTVVCRYALEHLPDELLALRNIHGVLQDHGRAIILVPQGPKLFGALDQALRHRRRYTRAQLADLGRRAGFQVLAIVPINRVSSPFWLWDGKVLKSKNLGQGRIKLFDALVPVLRRLDRWLPFPPLSLICVFEKVTDASHTPKD